MSFVESIWEVSGFSFGMLTIILNVITSRLMQQSMRTTVKPGDEVLESRDYESKTDLDFLRRLQNGDNLAWEQLLDEWQGPLFQYLCYSLPSTEAAQDVLSDTLEALVKAFLRFDGKAAISTFMYSIASRKIADYYRKRKKTTEIPETISTRAPSSDSMVFRDVLENIQPQYREALLLRYHMGLSVSEVAQVIGRSYKATESLLSRGRKQLEIDLGTAGFYL